MASSQVELASSAPFGCVLRDHNSRERRRDRCRDHNDSNLQKNLKDLVRDHLGCISVSGADSGPSSSAPDENSGDWVAAGTDRGGGGNDHHHHRKSLHLPSNHQNRDSSSSSSLSTRQARVLDRWAAKQAREIATTIEHEAELLSSSLPSCSTAPPSEAPASPSCSERSTAAMSEGCSARASNLGASSLVQIWEARLNHRPPHPTNPNLTVSTARTPNAENHSPASTNSDAGHSPGNDHDSCLYSSHHPCQYQVVEPRTPSPRPPPATTNTEAATTTSSAQAATSTQQHLDEKEKEKEKVRVADIIRRLTDHDHELAHSHDCSPCRERERPVQDQPSSDNRVSFTHVLSSPKILRGRQAFTDMLMQMERARQAELSALRDRQVVSKFSHRGRIQSMLRLRILQRGILKDQLCSLVAGNRIPLGSSSSTNTHRRERFNTGADHRPPAHPSNLPNPRSSGKENVNDTHNKIICSSTSRRSEERRDQEPNTSAQPNAYSVQQSVTQRREEIHEETCLRSDVMREDTMAQPSIPNIQENFASSTQCVSKTTEDYREEAIVRSDIQETVTVSVQNSVSERVEEEAGLSSDATWQPTNIEASELSIQETLDATTSMNDGYETEMTEEQEFYEQQQTVTNYDWISDISRPRSYWEDRRRVWYEEMLSNNSNNEIRQLLERKTVSSCLGSAFRERMDRLMMSHLDIQTNEEDLDEDTSTPNRMEQIMLSYMQRHTHQEGSEGEEEHQEQQQQVEEDDDDDVDDVEEDEEEETEGEEEDGSAITGPDHEISDYYDQSTSSQQFPSPSLLRDWSYHDNDSDQAASTASRLPSQSPPFYQGSRLLSPSRNNSTIEMELIYDLRSHIEQMHREMSELRSTIKCCVDMQLKLQSSIRQEVHSVVEGRKRSYDRAPRKGSCCICLENRVDSLLYRCGHMCACVKCAQELQWSSGKCPVCEAPIDDVVRAYADS